MKYVIRRQEVASWSYNPQPMLQHLTVDGSPQFDTGLIDQHGHKIMRINSPIGFGRDDERD